MPNFWLACDSQLISLKTPAGQSYSIGVIFILYILYIQVKTIIVQKELKYLSLARNAFTVIGSCNFLIALIYQPVSVYRPSVRN